MQDARNGESTMSEPLRTLDELPSHPVPPRRAEEFRLRVDGQVARPLMLGLPELTALAHSAIVEDFTCLEGWVVPGQRWAGVPLEAVLRLAVLLPSAQWVNVSSGQFSLPLPVQRSHDALLALSLNDAPLTLEHGSPIRLIVRGGECFTSVKWADHLRLTDAPAPNTAEQIARARLPVSG